MKKMHVISTRNLRELVNYINTYNSDNINNPIQKDDIVTILSEPGLFRLVYFN